jgi:N-acyl-D-aspartate/D-glutamate deacylase
LCCFSANDASLTPENAIFVVFGFAKSRQRFTFRIASLRQGAALSSRKRSGDPAIRQKLHDEVVEFKVEVPAAGYSRKWYDYMWVETPALEENQSLKGKTIHQIAKEQGKGIIDAFLDLVVEEKLDTGFMMAENNVDDEAMAKILTYPNAIVGLSDGGAQPSSTAAMAKARGC